MARKSTTESEFKITASQNMVHEVGWVRPDGTGDVETFVLYKEMSSLEDEASPKTLCLVIEAPCGDVITLPVEVASAVVKAAMALLKES